jgi:Secretion system C-terminal sorting domain
MKKIIFIAIFTFIVQKSNAQISFQKNYGIDTLIEYGNSVIQYDNETYFVAGSRVSPLGGSFIGEGSLSKFDKFGNEIWTKYINQIGSTDLEFKHIEKTKDNNLVVCGAVVFPFAGNYTNCYISKMDTLGSQIWSKNYGGLFRQSTYDIQETYDGGFILNGFTEPTGSAISSFYLLKLNSSGDSIWSKNYSSIYQEYSNAVTQTTDSGFVIVGNSYSQFTFGVSYIIKTNQTGDTLWTKYLTSLSDSKAFDVTTSSNGNIVVTGVRGNGCVEPFLLELDLSGNVIWQKSYSNGICSYANSICKTTDNGFAICGINKDNQQCYLIKTDSIGNQQWSRNFSEKTFNEGFNIRQTIDNGYIMTGITSNDNKPNILLIKTNGSGIVLSVENNQIGKDENKLYPNPITNELTFEVSSKILNSNISVLNSIGQTLYSKIIKTTTDKINFTNYSNGVYFIRIENKSYKIIKQ